MKKVLVTCPPMLGLFDEIQQIRSSKTAAYFKAPVIQALSEAELVQMLPDYDGWIIGDDPATHRVLDAGRRGALKAVVKWGIGIDNVNVDACKQFGLMFSNTPNMFGAEVADLALGYVIALARETFLIDRCIRRGEWPKPIGVSLSGKKVAVVGMGDIGRSLSIRLLACGMEVCGYDPFCDHSTLDSRITISEWPDIIEGVDFIVLTCALTESSRKMLNVDALDKVKRGVRIVNVGRGGVVDERALECSLASGIVHSVALDVYEEEPLPMSSPLRDHPRCIFGSHNASNTRDAVLRTTSKAIEKMESFLSG